MGDWLPDERDVADGAAEPCASCGEQDCRCGEATVTVRITVETWMKRVHMTATGPEDAVRRAVSEFWIGVHYHA